MTPIFLLDPKFPEFGYPVLFVFLFLRFRNKLRFSTGLRSPLAYHVNTILIPLGSIFLPFDVFKVFLKGYHPWSSWNSTQLLSFLPIYINPNLHSYLQYCKLSICRSVQASVLLIFLCHFSPTAFLKILYSLIHSSYLSFILFFFIIDKEH